MRRADAATFRKLRAGPVRRVAGRARALAYHCSGRVAAAIFGVIARNRRKIARRELAFGSVWPPSLLLLLMNHVEHVRRRPCRRAGLLGREQR